MTDNAHSSSGTAGIPKGARLAPPKAGAMLESLRGLGYTTATALADLIDNSISAHATTVDVRFEWNAIGSAIAIVDDGDGMSAEELDRAMRLGDRNPLDVRARNDLGRFGLGLKTASFSQCRRLTVASRKNGALSCLRWDLDVLASSEGGWYLLEGADVNSEARVERLEPKNHGTVVLWEVLDRIVTNGYREQDFLDLIDAVEAHLAMVFHRFLSGAKPRLKIRLNGRPISSWDPFMTTQPSTWSSPVVRLHSEHGSVYVQCHVLPHKDRLDPKEIQSGGGPDGWTSQQGFYVYRNERLLVAGGWLGLGRGRPWTREESHRLARIRVDIPNTADASWKIDVRKSAARPPVALREQLTRLAEDTRHRARKVFAHRGGVPRTGASPVTQAWRAEHFKGGVRYRIDLDHSAIRQLLELPGMDHELLKATLRIIEETVPVQRIWLDTAEARETPRNAFAGQSADDVLAVLAVIFKNMIERKGMTPADARARLLETEPFHKFPTLVEAIVSNSAMATNGSSIANAL